MNGTVYLASADSALLRRALEGCSGGSCLEMGTGNGGALLELSKRFGLVVGTDVLRPEMADWKEAGANYILGDVASCLRPSIFDLVAFNPPYVAAKLANDRAVEGGERLEVSKAFLRDALRVVKRSGVVIFLLNDDANPLEFEKICAEYGFSMQAKESERVFFEELTVFLARASAESDQRPSSS
jgi:release factor glutamine methyltransferase